MLSEAKHPGLFLDLKLSSMRFDYYEISQRLMSLWLRRSKTKTPDWILALPTLYEYFGIVVYFYANEHLPIHVHSDYQDRSCKAKIIFEDGKVKEILIENVRGRKPLQEPQLSDFIAVIKHNADDIVKKWNDYFVLRKNIRKVVIKKRYRRTR